MSDPSRNPWLTAPPIATDDLPATPPVRRPGASTLPRGPQAGVPEPDVTDRLPRSTARAGVALWWLGVHGGAGETTLAALTPHTRAAEHHWPMPYGYDSTRVVLVARSNARGLTAAQRAAAEWASGALDGVNVLGLVIVADAPGRLPRPLRDFAALVSGGVPNTWHIPWIEAWRTGEAAAGDLPKPVRALVADVAHIPT